MGVWLAGSPGLVGVIASDTARFTAFSSSLTALETPEGSRIEWITGHTVGENQNLLCRSLLASDLQWLWILGDDHTFAPDTLLRLLEANEPIIQPLCLQRFPPYEPTALMSAHERLKPNGTHPTLCYAVGTGGMLIQRRVIKDIGDPWFDRDQREDYEFCQKARSCNYRVCCHQGVQIGHLTTAAVWPLQADSGWGKCLMLAGGQQVPF